MDLPIDHFRLLGVSANTDSQTVLRTLQQRLDRAPDQGFTQDTLLARSELLQASAELLSDEERREAYERELTAITHAAGASIAALEIPPSKEVGGLLLLMEAGLAQEAFDATSRSLQPPQAPALGSSREADLTLLASLACQAAAGDYREQRRYEAAARTLQQGLQLLQRMGKQPDQRRHLEQELQALLPYRVLDLISRDLGAVQSRGEGIALLEQLVQQRGGLEGEGDAQFPQSEFQPFFKQIRQFLTVQEQVELFSRWAEAGSATADFLASIALTAEGFVQRKPERLQAAFQRLEASGNAGVEEFLACLQLLLGQVERAQQLFESVADPELRAWASQQGDEPLAQLCAHCRSWLNREVLPGFRDIEADADLDTWFADRDVQAYIDQQDRIRGRRKPASNEPDPSLLAAWPELDSTAGDTALSPASSGASIDAPSIGHPSVGDTEAEESSDDLWDGPSWRLPEHPWPLLAALAAAVLGIGGWLLLRARAPEPQAIVVKPAATQPVAPAVPLKPPAPALPLSAVEPSEAQLRLLLEAWLSAKASVLAGQEPKQPLDQLARANQRDKLERQRRADEQQGVTETVRASIESLEILERSPKRIAVGVRLRYSDELRSSAGALLRSTPSTSLRNTYVFARDGERWLLAAYQPTP